jgi:hypothetical protein
MKMKMSMITPTPRIPAPRTVGRAENTKAFFDEHLGYQLPGRLVGLNSVNW